MSYPSMRDKTTRRMVAYKVCNDVRSHKNSTEIIDELIESEMMVNRGELETLRSIINRRIHEYNCKYSMRMGELLDSIKSDISYM